MNRLGHCESDTFSIELETALAEEAKVYSNLLTHQLYQNPDPSKSVFHSEFDNYDQLLNSITGSDSVHTAHGIMLQETGGEPGFLPEPNTIPRIHNPQNDIAYA